MQETHFISAVNCRVQENAFAVFSAYGNRNSAVVSLLVGHSLDADLNVVFAGDGDRLIVADVAIKSFKYRVAPVYTPISLVRELPFFQRLAPFLNDPKRLVLVDDWNGILDPKIDKVGWGVSRLGRCESSLIDLMARLGREMWTWLDSSPSARVGSYLDEVLDDLTVISLVVPRST